MFDSKTWSRLPRTLALLVATLVVAPAARADAAAVFAAIEAGKPAEARRQIAALGDHPLIPWFDYELLRRAGSSATDDDLRAFLNAHDNQVVATRIRRRLAERLASRNAPKALLAVYRSGGSAHVRCRVADALWKTGRRDEAAAATRALWLHGDSRPDSCDAPFEAWKKAGLRTPQRVIERLELALDEGEVGLARYLARLLPEAEGRIATQWLAVHADPARVARLRPGSSPSLARLVGHGFDRWTSRDRMAAARGWRQHPDRASLPAAVRARVERRIGLSLAANHLPEAVDWLAGVDDDIADETVRAWRVTTALREGRMDAAAAALDRLTVEDLREARWNYWKGRVTEALGDKPAAREHYARAADERDFYGFLAADRLGRPYSLNNGSVRPADDAIARVAAMGAARRAMALFELDRLRNARSEWYDLLSRLDDAGKVAAAYIAHERGWDAMGIITMGRARQFDDLKVRFPSPFEPAIIREAARSGIERDWVRGIMRQESAYLRSAKSSAGAMGLMQIMPATGRQIGKRLGTPLRRTARLFDPTLNIRFGASYLADLRERHGGHIAMATAAYNAGPHRVRRWRPEGGPMAADIWIESIPFHETRGYVKRVLEYTVVHALLAGRTPIRLSENLPPVTPLPGS